MDDEYEMNEWSMINDMNEWLNDRINEWLWMNEW